MTEADFSFLCLLLQQRSGLSLTVDKRYLAESRLGILCRRRGIADIEALVRQLRMARDPSLESAVVDAMTTNETLFFRDQTPFNLFRDVILPERLAANAASRSLRIWCAAVSSGQEAYSLAMLIDELGERLAGWKIEILGTDISAEILEKARAGIYSQFEIQRGLPIQMLLKHFQQVGDKWQVSQRIRAMVEFRQHNLLERNDPFGRFDVIFCRNVLIYFDVPTKVKVLELLAPRLVPTAPYCSAPPRPCSGWRRSSSATRSTVASTGTLRWRLRAPRPRRQARGRGLPSPPPLYGAELSRLPSRETSPVEMLLNADRSVMIGLVPTIHVFAD